MQPMAAVMLLKLMLSRSAEKHVKMTDPVSSVSAPMPAAYYLYAVGAICAGNPQYGHTVLDSPDAIGLLKHACK